MKFAKLKRILIYKLQKIVKYATETLKSDRYKIYQLMKWQMDQMTSDIIKINDICKQVL